MISSAIDSGIVGTVSMDSELSTMGYSHVQEILNVKASDEVTQESYIVSLTS